MKNILSATLLFLSFLITSQEIDEEYLNSLPQGVREDVLERINAQEELEKPIYRRASTEIDKPIEDDKDESGQIFGREFFDTMQTTFMPINEPNLDNSYTLDFGDVLEIQLLGQNDLLDTFQIKRDGSINIPSIGKIFVSGLSLTDASSLIKARVKDAFIGTNAFVSLTNIRDIRILISGNAFNPGIYTLNGNSNILHALNMAGGISDIGSYRDIKLIRDNKVIEVLDLYDVLIFGKSNFNKTLRSGDTILVNPLAKVISIESGVLRPGRYELLAEESFNDLVEFSNGFNLNADTDNIIFNRVEKGQSKIITKNLNNLENFAIKNGDSIFIREFKYNEVSISGAIRNPGKYLLPAGTTLGELIQDAGGYDSSAYPFGGYLTSQKSLEINTESKQKLYEKFLNNLINNSSASTASDDNGLALILQQLRDAPVTGRVIAEFDLDVIKSEPNTDTILEDGDEILIPNITQQVYVQGEVSNPGAIRYVPGKDLSFYIQGSGGALNSADLETVFVIHPNGETKNLSASSRLSFILAEESEISVYPGSIIFVPRNSDLANTLEIASIWAPIISSVALSLTSLSVLNNSN